MPLRNLKMNKSLVVKSFFAGLFSIITIGILSILTYKTDYGIFLVESNNATYNKLTLDTHFSGDVNLHYLDHIIKSEDLFLKYLNKEVKISNNVKYNSNNNLLEADEIYLDLVSRTSKIYMKDKTQKVKAIIKN